MPWNPLAAVLPGPLSSHFRSSLDEDPWLTSVLCRTKDGSGTRVVVKARTEVSNGSGEP